MSEPPRMSHSDMRQDNYNTGDRHDDDAAVIDTLTQMQNAPADISKLAAVVPNLDTIPIPRPGRLIASTTRIGLNADPVMLLPADPNRKVLKLSIFPFTVATGTGVMALAQVAESSNLSRFSQTAFTIGTGSAALEVDHDFPDYTGAVWVTLIGTGTITDPGIYIVSGVGVSK